MSHLTGAEIAALQLAALPADAPYVIQGVMHTQFSVSRHYGGCVYQGYSYDYIPPTDELIRRDVVKWLVKHRRAVARAEKHAAQAAQLTMAV